MGPIRPHRKSRNGCRTCRGRRVKCDEVHPICSNCQRRELACVYGPKPVVAAAAAPPPARIEVQSLLTSSSSPTPPPTTTTTTTTTQKPQPREPQPHPTQAFLSLFHGRISTPPPAGVVELDLTRLELLHHYSTSTYSSFANHTGWQKVWRDTVPQLGFQHPFVLHATLAITALHLSVLHRARSEHYEMLAASCYHDALVALRNVLPRAASLEGNALFVASTFIAIYVFACPAVRGRNDDPRALTWFPVLRGVQAVLHGEWKAVSSEFAPLSMASPTGESSLPPLPELERMFDDIQDPNQHKAYRDATAKLRHAWDVYRQASDEFWLPAAFLWPVKISDAFVHLLMERQPPALVLLAHYSALFSKLSGFWWIGTRAKEELDAIERVVGERWSLWLVWVRNVCDANSS